MKQVENNWRKMWYGNFFFSHGDNRSRGVLIGVLIRDGLEFKINKEIKDQNGRILILDVDIQKELSTSMKAIVENQKLRHQGCLCQHSFAFHMSQFSAVLLFT